MGIKTHIERKGNICECGGYYWMKVDPEGKFYRQCEECKKIIPGRRSEDKKELNDQGGRG